MLYYFKVINRYLTFWAELTDRPKLKQNIEFRFRPDRPAPDEALLLNCPLDFSSLGCLGVDPLPYAQQELMFPILISFPPYFFRKKTPLKITISPSAHHCKLLF